MWPWNDHRQSQFDSTARNRHRRLAVKRGFIERLEPRTLLSCDVVFARGELFISGDENANDVRIDIEGNRVRVQCDDSSAGSPVGGLYFNVHTIDVDTRAGGDLFTIVGRNFGNDPAVIPRIRVDTGTGADQFSFTGDFRPSGLGPEGFNLQVDLGPRGDADSANVELLGVQGGGPLDVAIEELTLAAEGLVLESDSDRVGARFQLNVTGNNGGTWASDVHVEGGILALGGRIDVQTNSSSGKVKQSLSFPESMLQEIQHEAASGNSRLKVFGHVSEPAASKKLFVGGLSWDTDDGDLQGDSLDGTIMVTIPNRVDTRSDGNVQTRSIVNIQTAGGDDEVIANFTGLDHVSMTANTGGGNDSVHIEDTAPQNRSLSWIVQRAWVVRMDGLSFQSRGQVTEGTQRRDPIRFAFDAEPIVGGRARMRSVDIAINGYDEAEYDLTTEDPGFVEAAIAIPNLLEARKGANESASTPGVPSRLSWSHAQVGNALDVDLDGSGFETLDVGMQVFVTNVLKHLKINAAARDIRRSSIDTHVGKSDALIIGDLNSFSFVEVSGFSQVVNVVETGSGADEIRIRADAPDRAPGDPLTSLTNQIFTGDGHDRVHVFTKGYNEQTFGVVAGAGDDVVEYHDPSAQNDTQLQMVVQDPQTQTEGPILLGLGADSFCLLMDLSAPPDTDLFLTGGITGRVQGGDGDDVFDVHIFGDTSQQNSTTYQVVIDLVFEGNAGRDQIDVKVENMRHEIREHVQFDDTRGGGRIAITDFAESRILLEDVVLAAPFELAVDAGGRAAGEPVYFGMQIRTVYKGVQIVDGGALTQSIVGSPLSDVVELVSENVTIGPLGRYESFVSLLGGDDTAVIKEAGLRSDGELVQAVSDRVLTGEGFDRVEVTVEYPREPESRTDGRLVVPLSLSASAESVNLDVNGSLIGDLSVRARPALGLSGPGEFVVPGFVKLDVRQDRSSSAESGATLELAVEGFRRVQRRLADSTIAGLTETIVGTLHDDTVELLTENVQIGPGGRYDSHVELLDGDDVADLFTSNENPFINSLPPGSAYSQVVHGAAGGDSIRFLQPVGALPIVILPGATFAAQLYGGPGDDDVRSRVAFEVAGGLAVHLSGDGGKDLLAAMDTLTIPVGRNPLDPRRPPALKYVLEGGKGDDEVKLGLALDEALDKFFAAFADGGPGFDVFSMARDLPNVDVINFEVVGTR